MVTSFAPIGCCDAGDVRVEIRSRSEKRIRMDTLKEVVQPSGRKQVVMGSLMKQRFSKAKLKVAYHPNGQQGHPPLVDP